MGELADHSLSADHAAARHLAMCPVCAAEFQQYTRLIATLGALPRPQPSPQLRRAILVRLAEQDSKAPRVSGWRLFWPASAMATLALAGWLSVADFQGGAVSSTDMASMPQRGKVSSPAEANLELQGFLDDLVGPPAGDLHPVWGALDATGPVLTAH